MVINNEIETYLVSPERRLNQVCQFSVPNTCLFCIIISFKLVYIYIYHVFIWFRGANKNGSVSTHHHHDFHGAFLEHSLYFEPFLSLDQNHIEANRFT